MTKEKNIVNFQNNRILYILQRENDTADGSGTLIQGQEGNYVPHHVIGGVWGLNGSG
jgi:hypothetical protein